MERENVEKTANAIHVCDLPRWQHLHRFSFDNRGAEKNTWKVIILTFVMMAIEIAGGLIFNSMALLADGWHMGTHAGALGITVYAYAYARKHADNPRYTFGTGKVASLGGYTSAIVLGGVALIMVVQSVHRLLSPEPIRFNEAIGIAIIGFIVNLVSAWLLGEKHGDHNIRAAYLHVVADALTSILAIIALFSGKFFGWVWMDPLMGLAGSLVIGYWAMGLMKETGALLLDGNTDPDLVERIRKAVESEPDNAVVDLHVWHLGTGGVGVILSVVTHHIRRAEYYREILSRFREVAHVSVEIHHCEGTICDLPPPGRP